jgi:FkbM family methyltransferase
VIRFDEWWLPDGETHLQHWMQTTNCREHGRLTYQRHKYLAALPYVRQRRRAIDVGAHVGLWSFFLAQDFACVEAFEPIAAHRDCWRRNMAGQPNAAMHECALGDGSCRAAVMLTDDESSSGDTRIAFEAVGGLTSLDVLDRFVFDDVDFMKIDVEGYERYVLAGAVETIQRCRPVVIVEQKPGHGQRFGLGEHDAVVFLQSLGAELRGELAGDFILSFPEVR